MVHDRIRNGWGAAVCCVGVLFGAPAEACAQGSGPGGPVVELPYNGDANADGSIGTGDLLSLLDLYGLSLIHI